MSTSTSGVQQDPICPECGCKHTVKKGKRRNRFQTLQVYRCTECLHRFTGAPGKNKTYPLRLILEAVSTFNLGHPITSTQESLRRRFHRHVPERTIRSSAASISITSRFTATKSTAQSFRSFS